MKIRFNAAHAQILPEGNIHKDLIRLIQDELTFIDQAIIQANKRSYHKQEARRCLFNKDNLSFPTGLLGRVADLLNESKQPFELINLIPPVVPIQPEIPDWFWKHQKLIAETAIEYQRGIIRSSTGSGKTKAMALLISYFPYCKVLVTVPSKQLLSQTIKDLQEYLQEPIGMVGDSSHKWERVTVGIINSLSNVAGTKEGRALLKEVQVLAIDECHRAGSEYYVTVGNACVNTDFRVGLSATPWRTAGDDLIMEGVIGPQILYVPESSMIDAGVNVPPTCYWIEVPDPKYQFKGAVKNAYGTYSYPRMPEGKPDQKEVYERCICEYPERNRLVIELAVEFLRSDYPHPGIILVERIDHGTLIQGMLNEAGYEIPFIHGKHSVKKRESVLSGLGRDNKLCIASSILKEGVDVKQVGVLIHAGGGSSSSGVLQKIGRVVRAAPGKKKAIIIDFFDQEGWYLKNAANRRKAAVESVYSNSCKSLKKEDISRIFNNGP